MGVQAPDGLRSCAAALNLLSNAAGSYLAGSLIAVVRAASPVLDVQWLPQDLNKVTCNHMKWVATSQLSWLLGNIPISAQQSFVVYIYIRLFIYSLHSVSAQRGWQQRTQASVLSTAHLNTHGFTMCAELGVLGCQASEICSTIIVSSDLGVDTCLQEWTIFF